MPEVDRGVTLAFSEPNRRMRDSSRRIAVAVATVATFQVLPGKNQQFQANVAEGKKLHERLGGRVRVWQATIAGENSNSVLYVIEHDDLAAFANFTQKAAADSEVQAFTAKIQANPSATWVSSSLVTEVTP
jgi:hypothetical protein